MVRFDTVRDEALARVISAQMCDKFTHALACIMRLHAATTIDGETRAICRACRVPYPCPTWRLAALEDGA